MELLIFVVGTFQLSIDTNLNSNMELLIWTLIYSKPSEVIKFKFQYGATNILAFATLFITIPSFKFQYGATNMIYLLFQFLQGPYI